MPNDCVDIWSNCKKLKDDGKCHEYGMEAWNKCKKTCGFCEHLPGKANVYMSSV